MNHAETAVTAYSSGVRLNIVVTCVIRTCTVRATAYSTTMMNQSFRNTLSFLGAAGAAASGSSGFGTSYIA